MLMTDDCGLFLLFIQRFSFSAIKCDPPVFHLVPLYSKANNVLLIFVSCCLFLFIVESTLKGKAVNTCTLISAISDSALHVLFLA